MTHEEEEEEEEDKNNPVITIMYSEPYKNIF